MLPIVRGAVILLLALLQLMLLFRLLGKIARRKRERYKYRALKYAYSPYRNKERGE